MRTILISGANRGIGKQIAEKALKDGHKLSLGVRNTESINMNNLISRVSQEGQILVNKYEATSKISAQKWVDRTIDKFGKIDSIIHCAGIFNDTELNFKEEKEHEIDQLWKVNVMGPWYLTRACWDYLMKEDNSRVITLVSMSGKRSKGKLAGYTTSKFALMGLCQTIRNEGWENGLRVTTICPGWVNTDMAKNVQGISRNKMTQPEDIALIVSNILSLPNSCIPFEISVNCNLEKHGN